jgi:hypothetical protein
MDCPPIGLPGSSTPPGQREATRCGSGRAKAEGESSMVEKPGCSKTVKRYARQDPDGMVKAGLLEPECPICKEPGPERRMKPDAALTGCKAHLHPSALQGSRIAYSYLKDMKWAPKPSYRQPGTECAIPYQARASRERSLHSSQRAGKPSTRRRETGTSDVEEERETVGCGKPKPTWAFTTIYRDRA